MTALRLTTLGSRRRGLAFGLVLLVVLTAAACGGDDAPEDQETTATTEPATSEPATSEPATTAAPTTDGATSGAPTETGAASILTIVQSDFEFSPPKVEVPAGSTVTIENAAGRTPHTFTVTGQDISVVNEGGQAQNVTLDLEPGTYDFVCTFHKGMAGTLTIA